jgi:hypothetical protein
MTRCAWLDAQSAFSRTPATSSLAALTPDHAHKPRSETVQAVAEDRAPAADLAPGHATGDQSAQTVQVAGRVRAEAAGRASVVDWSVHARAQAAFLELAFPEALAEAAPGGRDEVWLDRYS